MLAFPARENLCALLDCEWDNLPDPDVLLVAVFGLVDLVRCFADMKIGYPDIAIFGLLVPEIEDVIRGHEAIRLLKANTLANARYDRKFQTLIGLMRLVLDLDIDHCARVP